MKKLILTLSTLAIFISPTVRAEDSEQSLNVTAAKISAEFLLTVESYLPTPCYRQPSLAVSSIDLEKQVVTFKMTATLLDGACMDLLGPPVFAKVDLFLLPIPSRKEFSIKFEGSDEVVSTVKLPPRFIVTPELESLEMAFFSGKLVHTQDQKTMLEMADGTLELLSNQATHSTESDKKVTVWGYKSSSGDEAEMIIPLTVVSIK